MARVACCPDALNGKPNASRKSLKCSKNASRVDGDWWIWPIWWIWWIWWIWRNLVYGGLQRNLNCVLLMLNALMRWSSVDGGTPSFAAAPDGPGDSAPALGERRFDDLPFAPGLALRRRRAPQPEVVVGPIVSTATTRRRQTPRRSSESRTARSRSAAHGCCPASRRPAADPASSCRSS